LSQVAAAWQVPAADMWADPKEDDMNFMNENVIEQASE